MSQPAALVFPDNLAALATCRELGRAGIAVEVLGSRRGPAAHSRYARYREVANFYDDAGLWKDQILSLAAEHSQPPVLFPTEDAALLVVERFSAELGQVLRLPYPSPGPTPQIIDKLALYRAAADLGIGVPRFHEVGSGDDVAALIDADSTWIAKPSCRYRIDDRGQVCTFLSVSGGSKALGGDIVEAAATVGDAGFVCVVQELIPGPFEELVSVGMCMAPSGKVLSSYTARKLCEYPEPFGDGLIVETIADPGITTIAAELLRSLGYWGICDVEFKRDPRDGRFKLLDANPRVWLWHDLGIFGGAAALALSAYQLAVSAEMASAPPCAPYSGVAGTRPTWVSPRGAAAFLLSAYRPGRHGWALPFRLTVGSLRTMLRNSKAFHDPIYLRPAAWREFSDAAWKRVKHLLHA